MWFILLVLIFTVIFLKIYCIITLGKCSSQCKLNGKVVLITGASRGIGYYTALNLAKRGAKVIITSRYVADVKRAQEEIIKESGNADIVAKLLDNRSLSNVRSFARDILNTEPRLDILINNAGTYGQAHKLTKDGLLPVMQINYIAQFLLTNLLLGLLKTSPSARIVNVASSASNFGFVFNKNDINNPNNGLGENFFSELTEYFSSKICMVSSTIEMAKRLKGQGVTVNALHPGLVYTKIYHERKWSGFIAEVSKYFTMKTPQEGAETTIHVAGCEKVEGRTGKYYSDCRPTRVWADYSAGVRNTIWEQSVRLSGLKPEEMLI